MISCADGCGQTTEDMDSALAGAWNYLSISKRWRCPTCTGVLRAMANVVGQGVDGGDPLHPESRGALPKETASTIAAPTVKS